VVAAPPFQLLEIATALAPETLLVVVLVGAGFACAVAPQPRSDPFLVGAGFAWGDALQARSGRESGGARTDRPKPALSLFLH